MLRVKYGRLLLAILVVAVICSAVYYVYFRNLVLVVGRVYVTGSEPFTQLAIEDATGNSYGLFGDQATELKKMQETRRLTKVLVAGFLTEGLRPPAFRTEKNIDLVWYLVLETESSMNIWTAKLIVNRPLCDEN